MRKIVAAAFVSLDGVMQAPGGPEEDTSGGFAHGGWTHPFFGEDVGLFADAAAPASFELVRSRVASNGVVIARYRRAGAVKTGSFAL